MSKITKESTFLTDDCYKNPSTSLLMFRFEPHPFLCAEERMKNASVQYGSIQGKDIYLFDQLFEKAESQEMREFSKTASFSRNSYGSAEAIAKGEKPAKSMNGKERWQFFSRPPSTITEIYKWLNFLSYHLDCNITTLPWELCDQASHGSPSVIANFLEEASHESMALGKHQDCNPENNISFAIPVLHAQEQVIHENRFVNGAPGKPWLVSLMLYVADEQFKPEYSMGTVFYTSDGQICLRAQCLNMRLVLFEGDIWHSIEESFIPPGVKTWRVSYVFKLIFNPKKSDQSVKRIFSQLATTFPSKIEKLPLGADVRA